MDERPVALIGLLPYIFYQLSKNKISKGTIIGGLEAGAVFTLGLWLQGWGH